MAYCCVLMPRRATPARVAFYMYRWPKNGVLFSLRNRSFRMIHSWIMPGIFIPEFDTKFPNDFVLDYFLQPLENSRAAREFSGNLQLQSELGISTIWRVLNRLREQITIFIPDDLNSDWSWTGQGVTQHENSFTGSGHWIENSGSSDETRRNSRSFPYMYESLSLCELETFCSSPHCIECM